MGLSVTDSIIRAPLRLKKARQNSSCQCIIVRNMIIILNNIYYIYIILYIYVYIIIISSLIQLEGGYWAAEIVKTLHYNLYSSFIAWAAMPAGQIS